MSEKRYSKETVAVHGAHCDSINTMDLATPIHMTSTFKFHNADHGAGIFAGTDAGYVYTRISNPTTDLFQEKMACLEGGEAAIATASGMGAIASVANTLALPGDNFVSCNSIYGGTFALFDDHMRKRNTEPRFVAPEDANSAEKVEALIDDKTKFLYTETPANPTLDVIDIKMWADIAKKHNIPLVVDNTFATPYLQRPLELGADIVVHSASKYTSGHGDLIGGVIVGKQEMINLINTEYVWHYGPTISPFNAWLFLRGLKTLAVRMEKHSDNAMEVAKWLEANEKVENVYYPGLESHSTHEIAKNQMDKFGGMISFTVKGGLEAGKTIMNNVKMCALAVSLGDCETLIQHPASMTHSTYSPEDRAKAGISDGLIRLSVGIENAKDIIADIEQALNLI